VADAAPAPCLYVLAGTNGAGKSSIGGAMFLQAGVEYFNPDQAARLILARNQGLSQTEANSAAWHRGRHLLERAIAERKTFAFETTLVHPTTWWRHCENRPGLTRGTWSTRPGLKRWDRGRNAANAAERADPGSLPSLL